jgi:L-alanine-DL-glutamate epimerase-like enolase superfamily enzyme
MNTVRDRIAKVETLSCSAGWRNYYFLKITTNDGVVGWSEYDEGFGNPGITNIIHQIAPRFIGEAVGDHEKVHAILRGVTRPGTGGVIAQALGAIENALLDAKAKILGVPCAQLLGGVIRDRVPVYWSHLGTWRISRKPWYQPAVDTRDGVVGLGEEVRDAGFKALKTNVYRYENGQPVGWATGFGVPFEPGLNVDRKVLRGVVDHLEALREGAGPDVEILLDLNFNAKTEGYIEILRAIKDQELMWVELDTFNPEALAYIRSKSAHPIASCETLVGLGQFVPFLRNQSVDIAIIDLLWNGAWQAMKIAALADANEVNVAPHNFYGHLATMMNLQFAAAVPNLRIMETDIDRIDWDDKIVTHAPEFENGCLVVPDRPGWGTEPNEQVLSEYPPNQNLNPIGLITYGR